MIKNVDACYVWIEIKRGEVMPEEFSVKQQDLDMSKVTKYCKTFYP